ncbi:MAG: SusC/RagA family TonB-linked outer membrane protein, partial [Dysgonamonadaceae bacterium]|nr:SusC/RagA family TonB-linked outer membrane protein [Dysgonamonadaceae bacterium]
MNLKKKQLVFLLFFFTVNLFAQQRKENYLTISFRDIPLSSAIERIENNSEYTFFYDALKIDVNQKVSLNAKETPVKQAITEMLANTDVRFELKKSQIILYPKSQNNSGEKLLIHGNVTDVSGEPLIGVAVTLKDNPSIGAITDIDGAYLLSVAGSNPVLQFKYIGFAQREEAVNNRKIINVVMQEESNRLEDLVVVGYGVQKKASVVAAITSISPGKLNVGTTRSISNDLAGNIAGIIAVQRSGEPGYDNSEFWIRGMSSFKGTNNPLVLVDGVERSLNNLDIAEIESFSVLKDASASAVYGVRGANGVILITTKHGHSGKTTINVSVEHSLSRPAKLPQFLDAADYLTLLNNINIQETGYRLYSTDIIDKHRTGYDPELYPDVNWLDVITNDFADNTRFSFDLAGGNEKLRYSFVGAYYNESGITTVDPSQAYNSNLSVNRFNLRTNVDMNVTPTTLLTMNIGGYLQMRNAPRDGISDIFNAAFKATPYMNPPIYQNGIIPKPRENENPWARLTQTGFKREGESKLETVFAVEQDLKAILKGLKIKGIFSYDYFSRNGVDRGKSPRYYAPATSRDPVTGEFQLMVLSEGDEFLGYSKWSDYGNYSTYLEGNINYEQHFGNHSVSGLLLYNQRSYDDGDQVPFRTQGFAGRAAYTLSDRYILEFNFGYNGSENFAKGKRFGFFPSIAGGWILSEEPFMEPALNYFNKIKFRASYGLAGNDRFYNNDNSQKRFAYITTIASTDGYRWGNSNAFYDRGGLREGDPGVADLTWETVTKTNLGLELGLFKMIDLQVDFFHEKREDIFMQRKSYPNSAGFPSLPWANYGIVTNKGFDISLDIN